MSEMSAIQSARASLEGYLAHGPAYWPGAQGFTLIGLDESGQSDGGGADVCRGCVREVASQALLVMAGAHRLDVPLSVRSAVRDCGPAVAYEIDGSGEFDRGAVCAECGEPIVSADHLDGEALR